MYVRSTKRHESMCRTVRQIRQELTRHMIVVLDARTVSVAERRKYLQHVHHACLPQRLPEHRTRSERRALSGTRPDAQREGQHPFRQDLACPAASRGEARERRIRRRQTDVPTL